MSTVIFDLEWNTGFIDGESFDEVIEIGAVRVDDTFTKTGSFQELIRPVYYRKMNPFIQKIIPITMDDLRNAEPFSTVVEKFFDWCGEEPLLIAWSTNDFGVLEKNLAKAKLAFPQGTKCYDLQAAYSYCTEKSIRSYSLKTAVEAMQLPAPEEQTFHDAYYDAQYTAAIGRALQKSYGTLPGKAELEAFRATQCKPKKEKIPLKYSVKKAIYSPQNKYFPCPICGNILKLQSWFLLKEDHFISELECECGNRYYPEFFCDHFRQNRCDAHFLLWGEGHRESVATFQKALAENKELCIYPYRGRNEKQIADSTPKE